MIRLIISRSAISGQHKDSTIMLFNMTFSQVYGEGKLRERVFSVSSSSMKIYCLLYMLMKVRGRKNTANFTLHNMQMLITLILDF